MAISSSIFDPLKQPGTWIAIVLGSLSLLNMLVHALHIELPSIFYGLNRGFELFRDLAFHPFELAISIELSSITKNLFVLYGVMARAYTSAISFIQIELRKRPITIQRDYRKVTTLYEPLESGLIAGVFGSIDRLLNAIPDRSRWIVRPVLVVFGGMTWPFGISQVWMKNRVREETTGGDPRGSPRPGGLNRRTGIQERELPPVDSPPTPKFPAVGNSVSQVYNTRLIILTVILGQFALVSVFIVGIISIQFFELR